MANMDFGDAFDTLAESEFWIDAAMVFAGFILPIIAANVTESYGPDLPDEIYGVAVVAGNEAFYGESMISVGGGLYTVDAIAQRAGVKGTITQLGA